MFPSLQPSVQLTIHSFLHPSTHPSIHPSMIHPCPTPIRPPVRPAVDEHTLVRKERESRTPAVPVCFVYVTLPALPVPSHLSRSPPLPPSRPPSPGGGHEMPLPSHHRVQSGSKSIFDAMRALLPFEGPPSRPCCCSLVPPRRRCSTNHSHVGRFIFTQGLPSTFPELARLRRLLMRRNRPPPPVCVCLCVSLACCDPSQGAESATLR